MYKVPVEPADAVVVSCGGFPKDINLYQATKSLENATSAVKRGGSIILVAECAEGIGNKVYECWNRECRAPEDAVKRFKNRFEFGGHKAAIVGRTAKEFKLYLVSKLPETESRNAFFIPAKSIDEALEKVLSENPDAKIHEDCHKQRGHCVVQVCGNYKVSVSTRDNLSGDHSCSPVKVYVRKGSYNICDSCHHKKEGTSHSNCSFQGTVILYSHAGYFTSGNECMMQWIN